MARWWAGLDFADLDAIETNGRHSYLDYLVRIDPVTREHSQIPVRLQVASHADKARARVDALKWIAKLADLKDRPTWAEAIELLGEGYADDLDTVALMALCLRDADAPQHQYMAAEDLDKYHARRSIFELYDRITWLDSIEDPRQSGMSEEDFWAAVLAIDKVQNISPLAVIDGLERDSFIVSMASRLSAYRTSNASLPSGETSMPGNSPRE